MNFTKVLTLALITFLLQACCVLGTRSSFEQTWRKQGVSATEAEKYAQSCSEVVNDACVGRYKTMCERLLNDETNIVVEGKTVKEMTGIRSLESTRELCMRKDEGSKKMAYFCGTPKIDACMMEQGFEPAEIESKECNQTLPVL